MRSLVFLAMLIFACGGAALLITSRGPEPGQPVESGGPPHPRSRTAPSNNNTSSLSIPSVAEVKGQEDAQLVLRDLKEMLNGPPDRAVPALAELLHDNEFVASLLKKHPLKGARGMAPFMRALALSRLLREVAAGGGPNAAENLVALLGEFEKDAVKDPYKRRGAIISALGKVTEQPSAVAALETIASSKAEYALFRSPALATLGAVGTERTARAAERIASDASQDQTHRYNVIWALSGKATAANIAALTRIRRSPPGPRTDERMVLALARMGGARTYTGSGLKEAATGAVRQQVVALLREIAADAAKAEDRKSAARVADQIEGKSEGR